MTTQGNGQAIPYEVHMSEVVKSTLFQIHNQRAQKGKGQEIVSAFEQVVERLRKDPWTFGEALYHLPALKLQVRQGVIAPLVVDFGVHEERRLVFIRGFKLLG